MPEKAAGNKKSAVTGAKIRHMETRKIAIYDYINT